MIGINVYKMSTVVQSESIGDTLLATLVRGERSKVRLWERFRRRLDD
ncbi:UNVERIFIED_CONTAM: hypothetical protein ABIC26_005101 [Paenibacillus sp. PvR008]